MKGNSSEGKENAWTPTTMVSTCVCSLLPAEIPVCYPPWITAPLGSSQALAGLLPSLPKPFVSTLQPLGMVLGSPGGAAGPVLFPALLWEPWDGLPSASTPS